MSGIAERRFVRQQGFRDASKASCAYQRPALMFQPRLVAGAVLLAVLLQSALLPLTLAGVLGRFRVGAYLYHRLRGDADFADRTLPWRRGE